MNRIFSWLDSRRLWPGYIFAILVICYISSAIIPPFQAPDEFSHINRAYLLGHGQLVLRSENGSGSGGQVDSGLVEYMVHFNSLAAHPNNKISIKGEKVTDRVMWTGNNVFQSPTGTSYYFPALYAPQAIGLMTGQLFHFSISHSYYLARILTLFSCISLIYLGCRIYPPPPILLALFALPMNLFLISTPALDGMATATATVAFAAFMRISNQKQDTPPWIFNALTVSVVLVTSCRANTLPFLLLLFMAWWFIKGRSKLLVAIFATMFVCTWTLYTIKTTVPPAGPRHVDYIFRLMSCVLHPLDVGKIFYATFTNRPLQILYTTSFLGVLGWLDAPFDSAVYSILASLLCACFIFSIAPRAIHAEKLARLTMLFCVLVTIFLTFFALLIQWTVAGSDVIQGVQGRYFIISAIAIAFALCGNRQSSNGIGQKVASSVAIVLLATSAFATMQLLVSRYYTSSDQVAAPIAATPAVSLMHNLTKSDLKSTVNPVGHCSLDEANNTELRAGSRPITVKATKELTARGWVVSESLQSPPTFTLVLSSVNGSEVYGMDGITGVARPDVASALKTDDAGTSGFNLTGKIGGAKAGIYKVMILIKSSIGAEMCDTTNEITIAG